MSENWSMRVLRGRKYATALAVQLLTPHGVRRLERALRAASDVSSSAAG